MHYALSAATSTKSGLLKRATKLTIMLLLTFAPAGVAARVLAMLGKGPLRFMLALVLEPLLKRLLTALVGRYARESNEKTAK